MHDLARVRALRLCPWCADLKRIGAIACAACLDDHPYGDLLITAGALERRLAHADLLSLAERAARAAQRATRRANEAATSIAAAVLWRGFAEDEAGSARQHVALWAMAATWAGCLILLALELAPRVSP
jgi:hypothetical protein